MVAELEGLHGQIERVIKRETFRTSEALQRLLLYLGEKTAAGRASPLKEYTDASTTSGAPGHDAAVRMQVGRLRQKLTEYCSAEG